LIHPIFSLYNVTFTGGVFLGRVWGLFQKFSFFHDLSIKIKHSNDKIISGTITFTKEQHQFLPLLPF